MSKLYIKCETCGFNHETEVLGYQKICCPNCDTVLEYYFDYETDNYSARRYEPMKRRGSDAEHR